MPNSSLTGQLIVDLQTPSLTQAEAELIQQPCVSGVILFSRNIETPEQVKQLAQELKQLKPELILAVDQEGGRVQRLKEGFTRLPPVASLGKLHQLNPDVSLKAAKLLGQLMASEVIDVGLDLSFAPVLDLDYATSQVIGDRAFASSAETVISLASAYIAGMQTAGMAAVGKHFPGHGYAAADSHLSLPEDTRSLAEIEASCLRPFAALAQQLAGVMPAHLLYSQVDSQPAGFSAFWLNYLRQQLGFTGTIFSDDLSMAGAASQGSYSQRAAAALAAGCNQLLVCNNPTAAVEVAEFLLSASATVQQENQPTDRFLVQPVQQEAAASWLASSEAKLSQSLAAALIQQDFSFALDALLSR